MGVKARIVLYASGDERAREAARAAFERIAGLDAVLSDYRRDSEVSRLARAAGEGPVPASADLLDALECALLYSRETEGAFDVTVGPIVREWRALRRHPHEPDRKKLDVLRALVGADKVLLDIPGRRVGLLLPGMSLDFGGIGKGYACDRALEVLRSRGISSCLIDLGGDIMAGDPPPGRTSWRLSLGEGRGALAVADAGVATSGDAEQYVEIGGVRYSHIVDPRTGLGLTDRSRVTVVAPTATEADALASAVSVLGPRKGLALVEGRPGTEALVETVSPSGRRERRSTGWPEGSLP